MARVNRVALKSIQAAAHPGLEILSIGVWDGEPLTLAPVTGLPHLRTLTAFPGTLADPLEIAGTGLEFLELGPRSGASSSTPEPSRAVCRLPPSRCTATGTPSRSWQSLTNSLPSGTAPRSPRTPSKVTSASDAVGVAVPGTRTHDSKNPGRAAISDAASSRN